MLQANGTPCEHKGSYVWLQERVVGGFANGTVIRAGSGGEGWDAGYSATLQTPGAEPVDEGFTWRNVLASYVHLHFGSNPALAAALVDRCCQVLCYA